MASISQRFVERKIYTQLRGMIESSQENDKFGNGGEKFEARQTIESFTALRSK